MALDKNSRKYLDQRRGGMKNERSSFITHYRDLSDYIQPRRGRFLTTDRNRGEKRHNVIINSRGSLAWRTARAGLQAGLMSPTRPWHAVRVPDPDLMKFRPVKIWTSQIAAIQRQIFSQSNLYNASPQVLGEMLLFGQGCMSHEDDFEDLARFYPHTVGSYMIAQNARHDVTTLVREYEMTVEQLVTEFGLENVSREVELAYDQGNYEQWIPVVSFVEPNPDADPSRLGARFKAWRSIRYELGSLESKNKFLRRSGFDRFPAYAPRWERTGEDIYGTDCPGMTSLGDVKGLQAVEKMKAQALQKIGNPPLTGPASFNNVPVSSLPGGGSFAASDPNDKLRSIYDINLPLGEITADIERLERRIEEVFYVPLFRPISGMEGVQPKNQMELLDRNQEALLELGPMLENVHGELHEPLIDRTFQQMIDADMVPPAPVEIQGLPLEVRFISPLAIAQRAVATGNIERLIGLVGGINELSSLAGQDAADKVDWDELVDEFAANVDSPPRLVVPTEEAREARAERAAEAARQQQAQMAMEAAKVGGGAMRDLGTIDMGEDSAGARTIDAATELAGGQAQ